MCVNGLHSQCTCFVVFGDGPQRFPGPTPKPPSRADLVLRAELEVGLLQAGQLRLHFVALGAVTRDLVLQLPDLGAQHVLRAEE